VLEGVKLEKTRKQIKLEIAKKRSREQDPAPIIMLPVEIKTRESVEAAIVDLTGDD